MVDDVGGRNGHRCTLMPCSKVITRSARFVSGSFCLVFIGSEDQRRGHPTFIPNYQNAKSISRKELEDIITPEVVPVKITLS